MVHSHVPAWESNKILILHGLLHELPQKAVSFLPKFNGEGNITALEHIRKYEFVLLDIQYEYVVCRLFTSNLKVRYQTDTLFFPLILFMVGPILK